MEGKGEIKTNRIRKYQSENYKNKMERCKTKRKSPQYVPPKSCWTWLKINFLLVYSEFHAAHHSF